MTWNRRALVSTAALALAGTLAACGASSSSGSGGASSGPVALTFYLSGDVNIKGMWDNVIIPGFTKDNPGYSVKIVFSEHGVNDTVTLQRLTAAVKANQNAGADLYEAAFVNTAASSGLLADATAQDIPNLSKVSKTAVTAVGGKATPYRGSSVVLAYDSKNVPNPPKTLDDLIAWIKANPGKFTYNSPSSGGSGYAFAETVLDRYISPSDLTKMDTTYDPSLESNWDKGWQDLHALTKNMYQGTYPNGNNAVLDLLARGQIWMAPVWSDQALSGLATGQLPASVKLGQVTDPAFTGGLVYLGIPKNADAAHKAAAYKLLNWLLDPAHQGQVVNAVKGYPAIEQNYLPADTAKLFAGLNTSDLRANYEAKTQNDLKQQWQTRVP